MNLSNPTALEIEQLGVYLQSILKELENTTANEFLRGHSSLPKLVNDILQSELLSSRFSSVIMSIILGLTKLIASSTSELEKSKGWKWCLGIISASIDAGTKITPQQNFLLQLGFSLQEQSFSHIVEYSNTNVFSLDENIKSLDKLSDACISILYNLPDESWDIVLKYLERIFFQLNLSKNINYSTLSNIHLAFSNSRFYPNQLSSETLIILWKYSKELYRTHVRDLACFL